jgi:hypothetical protein
MREFLIAVGREKRKVESTAIGGEGEVSFGVVRRSRRGKKRKRRKTRQDKTRKEKKRRGKKERARRAVPLRKPNSTLEIKVESRRARR